MNNLLYKIHKTIFPQSWLSTITYKEISKYIKREKQLISKLKKCLIYLNDINSWLVIIPIVATLYFLCFIDFDLYEIFILTRNYSNDLISKCLTGFITLFSISISLSIFIINAIQQKNKNENLFSFIYKEIGLFSLLYFSITNIALLVFITLLQETIKNDYIFIKSAVLSCYMLIIEIILITMFFRKMFKLLDSNYLSLVYINKLKEDIYSNTKDEIISKYSCYLFNKRIMEANIKPHWIAINENEYKISVTENDITTIKDIKYKHLIKQIQKESKLGITVKAELGINIATYKNDAVITAENKNIEKIKQKFINSFQLSKWNEETKFLDKEVLKTKLVSEINEHNYVGLKITLDIYESIYESFIKVSTIYSIEDEPEKYKVVSFRPNEWE